ncbi:uncharacterized protein LOC118339181 isoform X2 [Morone saxatilis]|uniref:uncharacterized protein LOC118339181 isoform X2 n=1 Tax=Morone saxatilis TaxID=34816 RepID=UPI0015E1D5E5|nr:uncharacterized protein LOC118339181 isoform X2 [Morone saxatilis]
MKVVPLIHPPLGFSIIVHVSKQQQPYKNIKPSSKCKLIKDQIYSLDCPEASKIQPEKEEFDLEFGPNYDPMFEIWLPANKRRVILTVQDQTQIVLWKREVDLTDSLEEIPQRNNQADDRVPAEDRVQAEERLFSVRAQFISRVSEPVLNQLLDKLLECRIINDAEMHSIKTKARDEKARDVIDTVLRKNASSALIAAHREVDPCLSRELNLN